MCTYLYDHLYPTGGVEHPYGHLFRFSDDMVITASSWKQAEKIMQAVSDFLRQRGLSINYEKAQIVHINQGFNFVGRHYQKVGGVLEVQPSERNIQKTEKELADLILNFRGSQRSLISAINAKLADWGDAQKTNEDAYFVFRHIDSVVNGLLVRRYYQKYRRWKPERSKASSGRRRALITYSSCRKITP